jgi:hypothetical protein
MQFFGLAKSVSIGAVFAGRPSFFHAHKKIQRSLQRSPLSKPSPKY